MFRALLSCLANRSIKLWTCTKSKKYDKITKTWISPGFMPGFCPAFCKKIAQIITKISLDEELVTLDLPCMTSCSPTTGPFGPSPTQPSCLVSLYLSQYDELRVAGGVEGGLGDLPSLYTPMLMRSLGLDSAPINISTFPIQISCCKMTNPTWMG